MWENIGFISSEKMHSEDAKQEHRIRKEMMPREVFEARYVYGLRKNEVRYFFF